MNSKIFRREAITALAAVFGMQLTAVQAAEGDDPAIKIKLPKDIQFPANPTRGNDQIVLAGDPSKPGLYIIMMRWNPHNMSRPHFHEHDRYIYVVSGTWWLGSGPKYDPDSTKPVPAGTWVNHVGKELHYDGAKDEPCVLYIVGEGPATNYQPDGSRGNDKK